MCQQKCQKKCWQQVSAASVSKCQKMCRQKCQQKCWQQVSSAASVSSKCQQQVLAASVISSKCQQQVSAASVSSKCQQQVLAVSDSSKHCLNNFFLFCRSLTLLEQIGEGAFGCVFRAELERAPGDSIVVAVKMLKNKVASQLDALELYQVQASLKGISAGAPPEWQTLLNPNHNVFNNDDIGGSVKQFSPN